MSDELMRFLEMDELEGTASVLTERVRQIQDEGWTPEHDADHLPGELLAGGRSYLLLGYYQLTGDEGSDEMMSAPPPLWPWGAHWWKPSTDPMKNIRRGTALCCAELDARGSRK